MSKVIPLVIVLSAVLFSISFLNRNQFPEKIEPVNGLLQEPKQNTVNQAAFSVRYNDITYVVEPQYQYELYGLVVSYRHHSGDSMLHKLWNDHLNTADICVVWGKTALSTYLNQFDFWNGQFTCNFKTKNRVAWNSFNQNEISNNHLISDDDYIRDKIQELNIGDQVYIAGFLSAYGADGSSKRGTSTTRADRGNGACETIYVRDFNVVKRSNNHWRIVMNISAFFFLLSVIIYFVAPFRAS